MARAQPGCMTAGVECLSADSPAQPREVHGMRKNPSISSRGQLLGTEMNLGVQVLFLLCLDFLRPQPRNVLLDRLSPETTSGSLLHVTHADDIREFTRISISKWL